MKEYVRLIVSDDDVDLVFGPCPHGCKGNRRPVRVPPTQMDTNSAGIPICQECGSDRPYQHCELKVRPSAN